MHKFLIIEDKLCSEETSSKFLGGWLLVHSCLASRSRSKSTKATKRNQQRNVTAKSSFLRCIRISHLKNAFSSDPHLHVVAAEDTRSNSWLSRRLSATFHANPQNFQRFLRILVHNEISPARRKYRNATAAEMSPKRRLRSAITGIVLLGVLHSWMKGFVLRTTTYTPNVYY